MVPWSWLQEVCKNSEGEDRRIYQPSLPTCKRIFSGLWYSLIVRMPYSNGPQANGITTPSFAATCFEELPELSKDGVDEEAIRGVSGTIYLGGCQPEKYHSTNLTL